MYRGNSYWQAPWPAPPGVGTAITTRTGGVSAPPFEQNNLALHVGDSSDNVMANRRRLAESTGVTHWQWLQQVHGTAVVPAQASGAVPEADGSYTQTPGLVCVVLTADCLPVLLCNRAGTQVAAVHAGWKGLAAGIVAAAVTTFDDPRDQIMAFLAPAIGPRHFEVDQPVLDAFEPMRQTFGPEQPGPQHEQQWQNLFQPVAHKPGHFLADLYALARWQLQGVGVSAVWGGQCCTFEQQHLYYSYRRDGQTGRFASAIWLQEGDGR